MKILHFGKYYPPFFGGVEKVNYDLVEKLNQKKGCQVDELCFAHNKDYCEVFEPKGYRLFRVPIWAVKASQPLPKGILKSFLRIRNDYDIIHVHAPNPIASIVSLLAPRRTKLVVHWHSDIIKQKQLLKLFHPFQTAFLKRANAIIATSEPYAASSSDLKPFIDKVKIIPIGLDPKEMTYQPADVVAIKGKYGDKKIVLCIGRLTFYKGHKNLIKAASLLNDDSVVLIGGVGELEEELKSYASRCGVNDKVKFIGRIPSNQIYAYYKAADVFCLPSITKAEAFGVVLIEALAMGTPIVTCNIEGSGVPWVNEDGETGFNVPINDPNALAQSIAKIIGNDGLRQRMSENCVKRFNHYFILDRMVESTYSLYTKLIIDDNYLISSDNAVNIPVVTE